MFASIPRRAVPATRAGATPCPALRAHALYRAVALALALCLLLPGTPRAMAAAPPQARAALHATLQQKLDSAFARYKTLGAVVCVIENGAVTDTFTYGVIAPDGAPMTADTLFRVGSISKMVTAVGVMQLVERGTLALDGDVGAVLGIPLRNPQYPDIPITLRQLMSHSAGLRDSGHYTIALRGEARPLAELFAQPQVRYLFHPGAAPGSRTEYSNFGGGLLGSVLEAATGQTVDAYMAANVFSPLGITAAYQSGALPAGVTVSDMYIMPGRRRAATVWDDPAPSAAPDAQRDYTLTAGKLILSAPDLCKLLIALCDGGVYGQTRVLTEQSAAAMRTVPNGEGMAAGSTGFGLSMNVLSGLVPGHTLYGHGGKANGMLCAAYFDPGDRTGVVMLTNGCNNRPTEQNVGKLSLLVLRTIYADWLDQLHQFADPWLVGE